MNQIRVVFRYTDLEVGQAWMVRPARTQAEIILSSMEGVKRLPVFTQATGQGAAIDS